MAELRWAQPSRDHLPEWAALLAAIEVVDQRGETYELADLDDEWASVWSHPETDSVFGWDGPELIAFGWLKTQVGHTREHRMACWGGVRPSHRGREIGRELLDRQVRRASEVAATLDPLLPVRINLDVAEHQRDLRSLADRAGFAPARRFLEVARPTADLLEAREAPAGLELVGWRQPIDEDVRHAHRDAFVDHWGSEPRSEEEWRQWHTGHRSFRSDLSVAAVDPASAEVAAFALCAAYPQDWVDTPVEAWVTSVGTRRAWRGKGLARWVLTEALRRIASSDTGFERAILGVDADNPTGALGLYRSLGFVDVRATTVLARAPLR
jgi:ribosomal protein S18 acetylase RimI-like enzyme